VAAWVYNHFYNDQKVISNSIIFLMEFLNKVKIIEEFSLFHRVQTKGLEIWQFMLLA